MFRDPREHQVEKVVDCHFGILVTGRSAHFAATRFASSNDCSAAVAVFYDSLLSSRSAIRSCHWLACHPVISNDRCRG